MRQHYDPATDALYLRLAEGRIAEREEVRENVVFDFDVEGCILAIEVLDAFHTLGSSSDLLAKSAA